MDMYNVQREKLNKQELKIEEVDELGNLLMETNKLYVYRV